MFGCMSIFFAVVTFDIIWFLVWVFLTLILIGVMILTAVKAYRFFLRKNYFIFFFLFLSLSKLNLINGQFFLFLEELDAIFSLRLLVFEWDLFFFGNPFLRRLLLLYLLFALRSPILLDDYVFLLEILQYVLILAIIHLKMRCFGSLSLLLIFFKLDWILLWVIRSQLIWVRFQK